MKKLTRALVALCCLTVAVVPAASQNRLRRGTYAHFQTSLGVFTAQLETELAPKTVANFVALARGEKPWRDPATGQTVTRPFYDGLTFHRVVADFIIQSGDPAGTGKGGPGFTIPDEFSSSLPHDRAGVLSMANQGTPNSGSSQFFVTLGEARELNRVNSAFGHVVRGMDVVRKIGSTRTRNERPITPVILEKVTIEVVE
jgi:peptidyl-prolyl cis-trans isomerase A (cyclophilin A)